MSMMQHIGPMVMVAVPMVTVAGVMPTGLL